MPDPPKGSGFFLHSMRTSIYAFFCFFLSLSAWAQSEVENLSKTIDTIPFDRGVILVDPVFIYGALDRELGHKVEKRGIAGTTENASDALEQRFASVDIRSRGLNDVQSDISVRGSTFDQVLILVNGIPYSDPQTGHHSMNVPVPIEAIRKVSVLPSGGSYRFGPFAFAGVVNIETWMPKNRPGYAHAGIGQYGYQRGAAGMYLGNLAGTDIGFDMDYKAADGAFVNTDFSQLQTYLRSQTNLSGGKVLNGHLGMVTKGFGAQNFYSFNFPEQYEAIAGYSAALELEAYPGMPKPMRVSTAITLNYSARTRATTSASRMDSLCARRTPAGRHLGTPNTTTTAPAPWAAKSCTPSAKTAEPLSAPTFATTALSAPYWVLISSALYLRRITVPTIPVGTPETMPASLPPAG